MVASRNDSAALGYHSTLYDTWFYDTISRSEKGKEIYLANERVLVIDDGKDIRDFLVESILLPNGYQVLAARDGADGLRKALDEDPDFIIVDMQMPRLSGLELIRELDERGKNIPSILITAHGSEQLAVDAFRAGACDYVIKPFETEEILAAIDRAVRTVRARREKQDLVTRLQETTQQLDDRLREFDTLIGIGKSVASLLDLEQLLNRVVEAGVYLTNAEEGILLLLDKETHELYVRAAKNLDSELATTVRLKVHDSLAGRVIRTGEPLLVGEKGWQKIKTAYLVQSLLYVPLRVKDNIFGVLGVDNRQKSTPFAIRDQELLAALADYAAIAIENAQLFARTEVERYKLEAILRQTEDLVIVVDPNGEVLLVNQAAQTAFQIRGDAAGLPLTSVVEHPELLELFEEPSGRDVTRRAEIPLADSRIFNAHVTAIPGVGQAAVMQDITHLKELDRIKSEFVSVVSHDLRSPLTAILGYVELLSRAGPLSEMQAQFIQRVQRSVHNITSLIEDLLDLGRIEAGFDQTMQPYHLSALIRDVVEGLRPTAEAKNQSIRLHLAPHLPPNRGNPLRLRQVVHNLIDNAIKYTPAGGEVTIEAGREKEQVVLRVKDSGIGIAPADQPYIFDKFYRSEAVVDSHAGTGLGLSIVKSVVERHQGRIWVESQAGNGATFTVVLPVLLPPDIPQRESEQAGREPVSERSPAQRDGP
jgi:signal transduction histidine kinase/FixJ family two-component response regulator